MRSLTENDYKVFLNIKKQSNEDDMRGYSKFKGITRSEISEGLDLSYSKVRVALITLDEKGFIAEGIPKGKFKTVYITKEGLEEIKNITEEAARSIV